MILSQVDVEEYLATSEDFWKSFHSSVQKSVSGLYDSCKDMDYENFLKTWSTQKNKEYIMLLFQNPILKGEVISRIAYTEMENELFVLTNYRLIARTLELSTITIPLKSIQSYCENETGIIKFLRNEKLITLKLDRFMKANYVNLQISRMESENLDEVQLFLLDKSSDDLMKLFPELSLPQLSIPEIPKEIAIDAITSKESKKKIKKTGGWKIALKGFFAFFAFVAIIKLCSSGKEYEGKFYDAEGKGSSYQTEMEIESINYSGWNGFNIMYGYKITGLSTVGYLGLYSIKDEGDKYTLVASVADNLGKGDSEPLTGYFSKKDGCWYLEIAPNFNSKSEPLKMTKK